MGVEKNVKSGHTSKKTFYAEIVKCKKTKGIVLRIYRDEQPLLNW